MSNKQFPFIIYQYLRNLSNKIKNELSYLYNLVSMAFYERGRERLSLILQLLTLVFLKLIMPLVSTDIRDRIDDYRISFIKRKAMRNPVWLFNNRRITLRICITYRCNASCEFCYAKGLLDEYPKDMSLDDFNYLIKWAKVRGWRRVMFLGGEPTIHPQFIKMLDICYSQDIPVSLLTNALFDNNILDRIKLGPVNDIAVNYPLGGVPLIHRKQFLYNLESLSQGKSFLLLSGILDGQTDRWKKIVETAERLKAIVFWSLPLPTHIGKPIQEKIFSKLRAYGLQLFEILKTCAQKDIICFVCRPVPACIFTPEQWQQIRKIDRYLVFTRCFHGYRGDYAINLTVNPDLSTYPCSNFFVKGPHITYFKKGRACISHYFEKVSKDILRIRPMRECNNCQLFTNFLSVIENKSYLARERLCDKTVCQAGCVENRDYGVGETMHSCPKSLE